MSAGPLNAIAVFGEMLVDRFPGARVVGGAPFNVARHLAAFGHAPLMLGAIGTIVSPTISDAICENVMVSA